MFVSISVVVSRLCVAKAAWWKDDMHGCTRGERGRIRGLPVPSAPGPGHFASYHIVFPTGVRYAINHDIPHCG